MPRRPEIWLGDLLLVREELALDDEATIELACLLGLRDRGRAEGRAERAEAEPVEIPMPKPQPKPAQPPTSPRPERPATAEGESFRVFSRLKALGVATTGSARPAWYDTTVPMQAAVTPPPRPPRPLLGRLQRRSILSYALAVPVPEGPLDIPRIVRAAGRGHPLRDLPRKPRRTLRFGVELLVDRARWMEPFFTEQDGLLDYLETLLPADRLAVRYIEGVPGAEAGLASTRLPGSTQRQSLLALTDLGIGYRFQSIRPPDPANWLKLARKVSQAGRRFVALVPYTSARWPAGLAGRLPILPWSERTTVGHAARLSGPDAKIAVCAPATRDAREDPAWPIEQLARHLCFALRIDPWLIRETRLRFLPALDVGTEADLWFSALAGSRGIAGITLKPLIAERFRSDLIQRNPELADQLVALVKRAHRHHPQTTRIEETLFAPAVSDTKIEKTLRPALKALAEGGPRTIELARWVAHAWGRFPLEVRLHNATRQLAYAASVKLGNSGWLPQQGQDARLPDDIQWLITPDAFPSRHWSIEIRQFADGSFNAIFDEASPATVAAHRLTLPAVEPQWLQIESGDPRKLQTVPLRAGMQFDLGAAAGSTSPALGFQALTGERYRLQLGDPREAFITALVLVTIDEGGKTGAHGSDARCALLIAENLAILLPDAATNGLANERLQPGQRLKVTALESGTGCNAIMVGTIPIPVRRSESALEQLVVMRLFGSGAPADVQSTRKTGVPFDSSVRPLRQIGDEPSSEGTHLYLTYGERGVGAQFAKRLSDDRYILSGGDLHVSPFDGRQHEQSRGNRIVRRPAVFGPFQDGDWEIVLDMEATDLAREPAEAEENAVPSARFITTSLPVACSRASELAKTNWIGCVTALAKDSDTARTLVQELRALIPPWRVMASDDFPDEPAFGGAGKLARHAAELGDVLVLVGSDGPTEWLATELRLMIAAGKPILWLPLHLDPQQVLTRWPDDIRDAMTGYQRLGGNIQRPAKRPDLAAVAREIANWRPSSGNGSEHAPQTEVVAKPASGLIGRIGASVRQSVAKALERKSAADTGLFYIPLDGEIKLLSYLEPRGDAPILLLIHGEVTSTEGSFGQLWAAEASADRERLHAHYGARVLAFEYLSIGLGPIANTIRLVEALPHGAHLHIVSLGSGGLIGELLCRGERVDGKAPFGSEDQMYSHHGSSNEPDFGEHLETLSALLQKKELRIERFVRVACPAKGLSIYKDAPERAAKLLSGAGGFAGLVTALSKDAGPVDKLLLGAGGFAAGSLVGWLARSMADPEHSPGLASLAPDSGLIALLNQLVTTRSPLAVVTGISRGSGPVGSLGPAISEWLSSQHNTDLLVPVESAFGGMPRANGIDYFIDEGNNVNYFRYFTNPITRRAIVNALVGPQGTPPGFRHQAPGSAVSFDATLPGDASEDASSPP